MLKRQLPHSFETEDNYQSMPSLEEAGGKPATQGGQAKDTMISRQIPGTWKHTKNTDRASKHLTKKLSGALGFGASEFSDVASGELEADDCLESDSASRISIPKDVQAQLGSVKQPVLTQVSNTEPETSSSDRREPMMDEVADELFGFLCDMAAKYPADYDKIVTAVDTLNAMRRIQDSDLVQMQEKVERRDQKIVAHEARIAVREMKIAALVERKDKLLNHIDELKTYYTEKIFHAEYDTRIIRAELQHTKRDHEESKSGETERKLKDQIHVLEARLNVANGHLYGPGGKLARKKR